MVLPDGRKLLAVTPKSREHGRRVMDLGTDHVLTVINNGKKPKTYYAETTSGTRTFDVETQEDCIILHCANELDEKRRTQVEFHKEVEKGIHGEVRWQGSTVARIDKEKKHRVPRRRYLLQVASGMDPFLVLAIAVIAIAQRNRMSKPKNDGTAIPSNDGAGTRHMSDKDVDALSRKALHHYRDGWKINATGSAGNGATTTPALGAVAASSAAVASASAACTSGGCGTGR